jgi:Ca-activated chloride channel family protein
MNGRRPPGRVLLPLLLLAALVVPLLAPAIARADGVIIVEPPPCDVGSCPEPVLIADQLVIRSHRVDVTIENQIATTRVDQVFHNPNDWVAEGTYIFPIPEGATIGEFAMWVDGEKIEANILDADQARQVYDEIVRSMRDPALLEYVGRGAIQASVFPIPAFEDRRIEIEYQEVLTAENGLNRYTYGLDTERFSAEPLEEVSVRVAVNSPDPVRAVYSPTHSVAVDRTDDRSFTAGYEESDVTPDTNFQLFWSASPDPVAANLVSYWDDAEDEGYFMLLAAPGIDTATEVIARDVVVVLDTSGSMEGDKLAQAKEALAYVLTHLNPEDRFNVVEFSTGARIYAPELKDPSEAEDAVDWVEGLAASGGTDINLALLEAMEMLDPSAERPAVVLFLTDGLPTEGEVEIGDILENVEDATPENVRLFAFGVGDDVDTFLLDSLAQAHQGSTTYVRPGEAIDEAVSTFYGGISAPVLADLEIEVDGVQVDDIYPQPLPDLFAGGQLVVMGRYREGGPATIRLMGTFSVEAGNEFVPRLWATRKIGYLLNQIRLNGENQEWIQTIVDLSVRHGIVTPYTSYLITEDDILTEEGRTRAADDEFAARQEAPPAPASGAAAVSTAQANAQMAAADTAAEPTEEYRGAVRHVGARSFVLQGETWVETTFDPSTMTPTKVVFASDEYFALLAEHPELGPAFALGANVIAIAGGQAYEVVPA